MTAQHLPELWDKVHDKHPAETPIFYRADGTALTYKQMHAYIHCLAAFWMSIEVRSGENIVIWSSNGPYYASVELGAMMAGAVVHTPPNSLRTDELQDVIERIKPSSLYLDSYQFYRDHRDWLDSVARNCRIVCRTERQDNPVETDKITTFDGAVDRGKNYWRENRDAFQTRILSVRSADRAYGIYRLDGTFAGYATHGKLMELMEKFSHKGTALSAGPPSSLLERLGVLHNALRHGTKVYFHSIGDLTRDVVKYKPDFVSVTPQQLDNWRISALQNFKLKNRISGKFADKSIVRAMEMKVASGKVKPLTKFKHRLAHSYIFRPIRGKYFPGVKGIMVEGYSPESGEFYSAIELPLWVPAFDSALMN